MELSQRITAEKRTRLDALDQELYSLLAGLCDPKIERADEVFSG
jgi:hypothetical protein